MDFLKDETCSLISDAIYPEGGHCHPRVYDSFPRFLIRYVRERQVFTIEEAVRKMTSPPGIGLSPDRGTPGAGKRGGHLRISSGKPELRGELPPSGGDVQGI